MVDRKVLPQRRAAETFELAHKGKRVAVTVGYYADGSLGEVFVTGAKVGSELEAVARDAAVLLSIAIQHRVPLLTLRKSIMRDADGKPSTIIGLVIDKLQASNWE